MEKAESWDEKSVISQLNKGVQLANKLKKQLHHSSNSREDCGFLVEELVSCYDNALAVLNCMDFLENGDSTLVAASSNVLLSSEVSDHDSKDHVSTDNVHKKRKSLLSWSEEVTMWCETGSEGVGDDGYNWRKYGQKPILGATYPSVCHKDGKSRDCRLLLGCVLLLVITWSYFRCTHQRRQGCLARKQVQRMEDNSSSIFKVVYKGKHSCVPKQTKEDVTVLIEQQEEESQRLSQDLEMMISTESPENVETHFLSEPTPDSYLPMSSCFLNDDTFLGDVDFLIDRADFDFDFFVDAAEHFSYFQDSPQS